MNASVASCRSNSGRETSRSWYSRPCSSVQATARAEAPLHHLAAAQPGPRSLSLTLCRRVVTAVPPWNPSVTGFRFARARQWPDAKDSRKDSEVDQGADNGTLFRIVRRVGHPQPRTVRGRCRNRCESSSWKCWPGPDRTQRHADSPRKPVSPLQYRSRGTWTPQGVADTQLHFVRIPSAVAPACSSDARGLGCVASAQMYRLPASGYEGLSSHSAVYRSSVWLHRDRWRGRRAADPALDVLSAVRRAADGTLGRARCSSGQRQQHARVLLYEAELIHTLQLGDTLFTWADGDREGRRQYLGSGLPSYG